MMHYTGDITYDNCLTIALGLAAITAFAAPFVPSSYGRFSSEKFGLRLDPRLGWLLMELPATLSFWYFYPRGKNALNTVPLIFAAVWAFHYLNRGFVFPLSIRVPKGQRGSFSLFVIVIGWVVTSLHGYLNARYFSEFGTYTAAWLTDPRFLVGAPLYVISMALNIHSDAILRNLRTQEEVRQGIKEYRLPRGGLFRWVSSPSYFAELCAWTGFALATWSMSGVFILAISAANLIPRAYTTHRWYKERFPDYPKERKALIPWVW